MSAAAIPAGGPELLAERRGKTLALTLNRPEKMNALSPALVEALLAQVATACSDGTRLLVLRGAGRNFSAGFDMAGLDAQSDGDLLLRFVRVEQLLQALRHAPFETLALAHGRNFGAGVDMIAACARRVATPDATFRMPGLRFGLVLGTRNFADRVGAERARQVLQAAQTFGAADALAWGFVEQSLPETGFDAVIAAVEAGSAALSPEAAARLYRATTPDHRDADLAELVRSAAQPGLRQRIAAYLADK